MLVTYKPDDGEAREWTFDPKRVKASQGEMVERRYGSTWAEFLGGVMTGEIRARRVLLWHLMTREHPMLKIEDVPDFCIGELVVEQTVQELVEMRDRVGKADSLDEGTRAQIGVALDIEITEAMAREGIAELDGASSGKAS